MSLLRTLSAIKSRQTATCMEFFLGLSAIRIYYFEKNKQKKERKETAFY
jgi:hypothetical protein